MAAPNYRFKFELVDETTGDTIAADWCSLSTIHQDGACESVDMHVASMLRAFERKVRAEYERKNYEQEAV